MVELSGMVWGRGTTNFWWCDSAWDLKVKRTWLFLFRDNFQVRIATYSRLLACSRILFYYSVVVVVTSPPGIWNLSYGAKYSRPCQSCRSEPFGLPWSARGIKFPQVPMAGYSTPEKPWAVCFIQVWCWHPTGKRSLLLHHVTPIHLEECVTAQVCTFVLSSHRWAYP